MTLVFIGLFVVFGFLAFRNFSNGRIFWGLLTGVGCALMLGAVWVDYQRASQASGQTTAG